MDKLNYREVVQKIIKNHLGNSLNSNNVLVYAHDKSASYHTNSKELLKMAVESKIQGVIAEQNMIELYMDR